MKDFEKFSWLPFNQYLCSNAFKLFKETFSLYFHDAYKQSAQNQANTRSLVLKLKHPHVFWSKKFVLSNNNNLEKSPKGTGLFEFT